MVRRQTLLTSIWLFASTLSQVLGFEFFLKSSKRFFYVFCRWNIFRTNMKSTTCKKYWYYRLFCFWRDYFQNTPSISNYFPYISLFKKNMTFQLNFIKNLLNKDLLQDCEEFTNKITVGLKDFINRMKL